MGARAALRMTGITVTAWVRMPYLSARPFMMAQRYFDLRDPVNQTATVGHHGQVTPPATSLLSCQGYAHLSCSIDIRKPSRRIFKQSVSKGTGTFLSEIKSQFTVDLFLVL